MPRSRRARALALVAIITIGAAVAPRVVWAQFGGRSATPAGQPQPDAKEGPAEVAPGDKQADPALQPVPAWPGQKEKASQFFQLNGYLRFRAYLFHNLNLGYYDTPSSGARAPFYIPFSEFGQSGKVVDGGARASCAQRDGKDCRTDNLTSADMRLRLEPTLNVTDQVRVKAQLDVFDNLVLGSSPESYGSDFGSATSRGSQGSPFASIRAKRAWAEVRLPFAELRFGRMPSHWGLGMMVNNGDCLDCDYGVNADRVMVATKLWGHFFAFMWDWVATGPTTQLLRAQQGQGAFYNADTVDDVSQWVLALGKADKPEVLAEKLALGKTVFNYGAWLAYRQQDWAQRTAPDTNTTYAELQQGLEPRRAKAFTGDVWLRLDRKKLHLEAEGAIVAGTVGNLPTSADAKNGPATILSGGVAMRGTYRLLRDALGIHLEAGYASGDASELASGPAGQPQTSDVNVLRNNPLPYRNRIGRFTFDPDYHVDLILFRRILGAVQNAAYIKPGISYEITDGLSARADLLYAVAANPVAYPGNSVNLGLELDAQLTYKIEKHGIYAGLAYGVLFPFDALSQKAIYGASHDAEIAQTFQVKLAVKF